jgi:hypothetical protein
MFSNSGTVSSTHELDKFELSPNLILFDFDNIAPSGCFQPVRQSPRHSTLLFDFDKIASSGCFQPVRQSPRHSSTISPRARSQPFPGLRSESPVNKLSFLPLAQLNWVPFSDISKKDFDILVQQSSPKSSSKRKQMEQLVSNNKFQKQSDKLHSWTSTKKKSITRGKI